ncbi:hypothetical protein [Aeromicrobium fastidiosum]|uniref:Uncharacterized protein n=1 Tax=Aeromicrobium fastidiosum TaxID=52699 RepID=A0A641ANN8_9ACTN|nr:hypothetical protein [Aeromicrobium fastidiosum]KAA1379700.1 hypothetical protein ESP62_000310 [Aeromicrobium fastidiosum]MBP2389183.1 hypothetical protein [Aeromicrobium fastidiosum]
MISLEPPEAGGQQRPGPVEDGSRAGLDRGVPQARPLAERTGVDADRLTVVLSPAAGAQLGGDVPARQAQSEQLTAGRDAVLGVGEGTGEGVAAETVAGVHAENLWPPLSAVRTEATAWGQPASRHPAVDPAGTSSRMR